MLTLKECGLKGAPEPEPIDPDAVPAATTTVNNGITKSTSGNTIEKNDEIGSPSSPSHMGVSEKLSTASSSISIPAYQLFYDFKPTNYSDPIILYYPK